MSEKEYTYRCEGCPAKEACRHAWGKYWEGKSHGGMGCSAGFGKLTERLAERSSAINAGDTGHGAGKEPETLKLQAESVKEPWEIAHVTKGTSAGVYCSRKRSRFGKQRQEELCLK